LILATDRLEPQGGQTNLRFAMVWAMTPGNGTKATILIAEDDSEVRKLVATILQDRGFSVILAVDGKQALKRARDHEGEIQILLTDVEMGKLDGFDLRERLLLERPKIKVVVMSGRLDDEIVGEDFPIIRKPFSPEALISTIEQQLQPKRY
jgi:DNA-binding NtrC family response regulator